MNRRESFRQRYKYWKETGELPYSNGLKRELSNQALPEDSPVKSGIPYPKYDGGKDDANIFKYTNNNGGVRYVYRPTPNAEEITVRPLNTIFPDPAQWTFTDDNGRFYTPKRTTPTNTAELNPDNRTGFERVFDNYIGEAFNTVPKGYHTLPAIGAAAFGLANPAIGEAALTSAFGAHGISRWVNGEVNGPLDAAMTALEIAPLGRLAKPIAKETINAGKIVYNELYTPWKISSTMNRSLDSNPIIRTYESNPVYRDIGTLLDYQDYIQSMFPNSTIKDVAFHTTTSKPFEAFDPTKVKRGFGFYFSPSEHKLPFNRTVYARVNMENPLIVNTTTNRGLSVDGLAGDIEGTKAALKENNYDGIFGVTNMRNPGEPEIVALNPGQIHILGSNRDLAGFRRANSSLSPRITAENAARMTPEQLTILGSASGSPYKLGGASDLFSKHLYNRKINGYPSYTTDAMEFNPVTGDFTPVLKEWADDVVTGLPKDTQDVIMHDVADRNIAEFVGEGLSQLEAAKYAEAVKKQLNNVRSGIYSQRDYDKAGRSDIGGFYDPKRNFISINDAANPKRIYIHEGRHLLDHKIDDEILLPLRDPATFGIDFDSDASRAIMQRTRQRQEMILRDAYDRDFESIPSSKYAKGLEDYNSMSREAITTNIDSRTYAYNNFADVNSLNSGTRIEELPTEALNAFIDNLTDELVFEAVERANGYGERYIQRLREEGKLTPKKARLFRESMKHVGIYAAPIGFGLSIPTLNNK